MTTRHDDHRKELSDHHGTGSEVIDNAADATLTLLATDPDVGLAERVIRRTPERPQPQGVKTAFTMPSALSRNVR